MLKPRACRPLALRLSAKRYGRYVRTRGHAAHVPWAPDEGCNRLFYRMLPTADEPYLCQTDVNSKYLVDLKGKMSVLLGKLHSVGPHSEIGWLSNGWRLFAPVRQ
ncbi:hypothetical protein GCM10010252_02030 [Streptomyces aureoverticillatus]|nr:hypothetical protein GCM10010252_02030 [Streptomyces aureoverticillatus]